MDWLTRRIVKNRLGAGLKIAAPTAHDVLLEAQRRNPYHIAPVASVVPEVKP